MVMCEFLEREFTHVKWTLVKFIFSEKVSESPDGNRTYKPTGDQ